MLELKEIKKSYRVGEIETKDLDGVSVAFREKEFVAILGPSGSGKTTCLNIIGGLDRYDSGNLIIKGKSTKNFKDADWDAYRNNSIGFVFQNYNLIPHISIVANVEMGMTLSGISGEEKHRRALEVLKQVGLEAHLHKKPNQLSGGQMQRVAIARALANNPEILLCDEPTGALDTATSVQIMDLIKEVAKERLVIMVTHNPELAEQYADRIIRFADGRIVSDSHPHQERPKSDQFHLVKTSMKFITALSLSFNNIRTKKGRTFLTSFASSIGIIGIALILSLSSGFQIKIDEFQTDALAEFPVLITRSSSEIDMETIQSKSEDNFALMTGTAEYADTDEVYLYDPGETMKLHTNVFSDDFISYIQAIDSEYCSAIGYARMVAMNVVRKVGDTVQPAVLPMLGTSIAGSSKSGASITSMNGIGLYSYPETLDKEVPDYLHKNYDLLAGNYPEAVTDIVLIVDNRNRCAVSVLSDLGYTVTGEDGQTLESIPFDEIVGTELKIVSNNDYYVKTDVPGAGSVYLPSQDYEAMYASDDSLTVRICGVLRQKSDTLISMLAQGVIYSDELVSMVAERAAESDIVKAQREADYNIMSMEPFESDNDKNNMLSYLGGDDTPYIIMMYPTSFESKNEVLSYLDAYNKGKSEEDIVVYTDLAESISDLSSNIMDGITIVLIAFASISLVVSLIMICIITYTSVLERTKEIGILRALGARRKDITRVFDAETCILGVFSGVLGVAIAWLLTFPANAIIYHLTHLGGVACLQLTHAIFLVLLSTVLTMIGGHIPAWMASRKDAVEALRSE